MNTSTPNAPSPNASTPNALRADRVLCVYENQPLTTESTYAVPRITSQLLEALAERHREVEFVAASLPGGNIPGVQNVSMTTTAADRWRSRIFHGQATRKLRLPRSLHTTLPYRRTQRALQRYQSAEDERTIVLCMTSNAITLAKQVLPRSPRVYWIHSMPRVGMEQQAVKAINAADAVVVPSRAMYRDLFQMVCRDMFTPPVWAIPNFIDTRQFHPLSSAERIAARNSLGLSDQDIGIVYVGRAPEKGWNVIQTALRLCRIRSNKRVLVSVGGQSGGRRRAGENSEILEIARVPPEQLSRIYQACDVAVVPSVWWENCPLALLEMMSLGLCVVASRVGGIPEMIEHEASGFLVDTPNDVVAWAAALDHVLESRERRTAWGQAAQRSSGERFGKDRFLEQWESVIATVSDVRRQ